MPRIRAQLRRRTPVEVVADELEDPFADPGGLLGVGDVVAHVVVDDVAQLGVEVGSGALVLGPPAIITHVHPFIPSTMAARARWIRPRTLPSVMPKVSATSA